MAIYSGIVYGFSAAQNLIAGTSVPEFTPLGGGGRIGSTYHSGNYSFWTYVFFPQLADPIWSTRNITDVSCTIDVYNLQGSNYNNVRVDMRENVSGEYKVWNDRVSMPYHDDFSYEPYDSKLPLLTQSQYTTFNSMADDIVFDANSGILNIVNRWIDNTTDYRYGMCLIVDDGVRDGDGNPVSPIIPDSNTFYRVETSGVTLNITWDTTNRSSVVENTIISENIKNPLAIFPKIEEIDYSSRIDTNKINKQFKSLEESSLRAILNSQNVKSELNRIQEGTVLSNKAMGQFYNSLLIDSTTKIYASAFNVPNNITSNILYDTNYGYITLNPIAQFSKIPRGERYDGSVSAQAEIYLEDTLMNINSEIYDILDGTNKSFWIDHISNIVTTGNKTHIDIKIPPSLTKRFNYIEVFPFPLYGMKILDIKYKNFARGYTSVTNDLFGNNPLKNNNGEAIKIYLSPKEFDGTIRIEVESKGDFDLIGFSNIDIKFLDFDNTSKNGHIRFNGLDNKTRPLTLTLKELYVDWYFDSVKAVELITLNNSPITMQLVIGNELANGTINQTQDWTYKLDLGDINTWDLNDISIQLETDESLFLDFTLTENKTTTPVIRGAKIEYE